MSGSKDEEGSKSTTKEQMGGEEALSSGKGRYHVFQLKDLLLLPKPTSSSSSTDDVAIRSRLMLVSEDAADEEEVVVEDDDGEDVLNPRYTISLKKVEETAISPDDYVHGRLFWKVNSKSKNGQAADLYEEVILECTMPLITWCVLTESFDALDLILTECEDEYDPLIPCLDGPFKGKSCDQVIEDILAAVFQEGSVEAAKQKLVTTLTTDDEASVKQSLHVLIDKLELAKDKRLEELLRTTIEPNREWLVPFLKASAIPAAQQDELMISMARCGLLINHSKQTCLGILAQIRDEDEEDLKEFIPDDGLRTKLIDTAKRIVFKGENLEKLREGPTDHDSEETPMWKLALFQIVLVSIFGLAYMVLSDREYQGVFKKLGIM